MMVDKRVLKIQKIGLHKQIVEKEKDCDGVCDRSVDMATPLHHTWTYQALAHDVLQYSQNR
jgi:hypothetical protein